MNFYLRKYQIKTKNPDLYGEHTEEELLENSFARDSSNSTEMNVKFIHAPANSQRIHE